MSLRPLLSLLDHDPAGVALATGGGRAFVSLSMRPYLVAALLDGVDGAAALGRPAIVVAGDDRQARDLAADLKAWLHPRPVRFYPSRGVAYESHLNPPPHLVGLRVAALDALLAEPGPDEEPPVVVVSAVALSEKVPDPALRPSSHTLRIGELLDLDEEAAELVAMGYERVDQVEDRGQFAIRGGILDVYPATEDRALRVDLFDIEIESLRYFSTFTQRSLGDTQSVNLAPAAELSTEHRGGVDGVDPTLLGDVVSRNASGAEGEARTTGEAGTGRRGSGEAGTGRRGSGEAGTGRRGSGEAGTGRRGSGQAGAAGIASGDEPRIASGGARVSTDDESTRPDISELLPVDRFHSFLDLAPDDAVLVIAAEEEIEPALADHWQDVCAAFHDAEAHNLYVPPKEISARLDAAHVRLSSISGDQEIQFRAQAADVAARSLKDAEPELEKLVRGGYRTVVSWPRRGEGERAAYNLARLKTRWLGEGEAGGNNLTEPELVFTTANLRDGFVAAQIKLAIIPEHRLFRRKRAERTAGRSASSRKRGALRSFADLRTGDIVVHEDHGLARFAGFETKTVAGITRDYLQLEFAGTDRVFQPVEQLAKISRYVGAGGAHPPLSKLGGKSWETIKTRARKAAQELAGELITLYAERRRRSGHAFEEDSDWLREFEAKWPFTETADQREAIETVKADMERAQPMDRLICGDVGYGKTEVALRAAFKAAGDGKQVLVLAPTTILAQQHFGTFSERMADYPFTIGQISRFRTPKEQKAAIADFNAGTTDILIGTHRVLGRDMRPKDLGLLIVDEEQRFGVKQKELLRQLKLRVDVIAMSATPIPRTLQMSLAGLRDISVIETPPEGRRPVKTYIGEYDEELVRQALRREKERGGQAFFLHNRVESIEETAERLRGLCPGMSFVVAHGQLDETQLEERMLSFLRGEADVLVATSIIESGIDIPQANTLIVERADMFGLSQLYQIRGRVGRSRERAFAYLLYPSAAALTEDAQKRLSALSDYTELGAGFKIAMRDLELRGAGSLLGDEQSGHVAALGFELYMQMLDEAVIAAGPEDGEDEREPVRLDVSVDAYIPADYVPYEQAKIEVHRNIATAREVADIGALREELADRFGPIPEPLETLLTLQQARIKLGQAGARAVSFRQGRLTVTPVDLEPAQAAELKAQIPESTYEPGRSQWSVKVPDSAEGRFPAVVRAADVLLALTRA